MSVTTAILSWAGLQVALLLASLALVFVALRGKRVGQTCYCRRCGYNLTGRTSGACTECGAAIDSPGAVVVGEQRVRRGMLVAGLLLSIAGTTSLLLIAGGVLVNYSYYALLPSSWLLAEMESARPPAALGALQELTRRARIGSLTAADETRIADFCLKQQAALAPIAALGAAPFDALEALHTAGRLTAEADYEFLANLQYLEIKARPLVAPGATTPVRLSGYGRGPSGGLASHAGVRQILIDGASYPLSIGGGFRITGSGSSASTLFNVPALAPGEHTITVILDFNVFGVAGRTGTTASSGNVPAPGTATFTAQRTVTTTFRVAADAADAEIRLRKAPELDEEIRRNCVATEFSARKIAAHQYEVQGYVELLGERRIGLAFGVTLEADGKTIAQLGTLTAEPGGERGFRARYGVGGALKTPPPKFADLVLRPSRAAAAGSITLTEIWDGEVRIPSVEIRQYDFPPDQPEPAPAPATQGAQP